MSNPKKPTLDNQGATPDLVSKPQLKIATFNLFNYLEPPNAYYEFERIYSSEQWAKKQLWIRNYLAEYQPDVIGFQEVFSPQSLKTLVAEQGYEYFQVVDSSEVIDDFIYRSPVVAIASKYPIVEVDSVVPDQELAVAMGISADFSFNRQVIRATIDLPHIEHCDCYVVHFKSKRPLFEHETCKELSAEKNIIENLKAQLAGGWGSTVQRGSEATLLMIAMITRRESSGLPMILLGDFNNTLTDGVLSHLLTSRLRHAPKFDSDAYLDRYCLKDSWDLYLRANNVDSTVCRLPTHYYGAEGSVLDYILLSNEFDTNFDDSFFAISDYQTCDQHLINPIFARDGQSTDHAIVQITLTLRS
ncbi:endonuclease/exonuclease/phosphatase family protein [Thalassotalea sp. ND16A]|uniref:endonuclease/exonuclease/phosphatase family protein n=1 Tax=Thalassotalea sp. ND16A TaxID=1535422 RepID=UPI00051CE19E|nr:hypothetical protein ND16A_1872 [Thalassotalea sp. ND16A]